MNTTANITTPQPLISIASRATAALGVVSVLALALMGTAQASHEAVDTCTVALSRSTLYVTLPKVEIVGRRDTATARGA
ncbi:hypothetical protein [Caenimonas sp. SL110]|uniref:hypothetical protein n=1 Tax=Caenimonas sp. SL110 TaxID=1450524 RepID=UPI000653A6EF|nr:hypothetical protein [Caenimonas sp. SL110]